MIGRYSKESLDALEVADCDLYVSLFVESRSWIDDGSFREDSPDRVNWGQVVLSADGVQMFDHGPVKIAPQPILAVLRQRSSGLPNDLCQTVVSDPNPFHAASCGEIQTKAKVDDGPDDSGVLESRFATGRGFSSELQPAYWV